MSDNVAEILEQAKAALAPQFRPLSWQARGRPSYGSDRAMISALQRLCSNIFLGKKRWNIPAHPDAVFQVASVAARQSRYGVYVHDRDLLARIIREGADRSAGLEASIGRDLDKEVPMYGLLLVSRRTRGAARWEGDPGNFDRKRVILEEHYMLHVFDEANRPLVTVWPSSVGPMFVAMPEQVTLPPHPFFPAPDDFICDWHELAEASGLDQTALYAVACCRAAGIDRTIYGMTGQQRSVVSVHSRYEGAPGQTAFRLEDAAAAEAFPPQAAALYERFEISEFAKPSGEIAPHTLGAAEAFAAGYTQRIPRRIELPKQAEIEPGSQIEAAVARLFTGGTGAEYLGRGYFRLKGQSGFLVTPSVSGDFHSPVAYLVGLAVASNPATLVLTAAAGTAYAGASAIAAIGYIAEAETQVRAYRAEGHECADLPAPQCLECFGFTQYSDAINSGWQGASAGAGAAVVGFGAVLGVLAMTGPPGWLVIAAVGVTAAAVLITAVCVGAALHANMKQEEAERICVR